MIISSIDPIELDPADWLKQWSTLEQATTLADLVWAGLQLGLWLARLAVESELTARVQSPTDWPTCPVCGRRCRSKGMVPRQLSTLIGEIQWSRRVGRCPGQAQEKKTKMC